MAAVSDQLRVHGTVRVPGDKSISHRALVLAAVAHGSSRIEQILDSADINSTAEALRALGASIPPLGPKMYVQGRELHSPREPLDCGNSGTSARLLAGVIAGAGLSATIIGDDSLSRRPMNRVAEPLRAMGARVETAPHGGLPMTIEVGEEKLTAIDYESSTASAQVKSAILIAAILAGVRARVSEPHLSRDHTERMLLARGIRLERKATSVSVAPAQTIKPADVRVPADPSSAAFFVGLAQLADAGELRISDVCLNPTRTGFLSALRRMGATLETIHLRDEGGESAGTIVAVPSRLRGTEIAASEVPTLIDELPLFACLAARAEGESIVRGAAELRLKESDRIATIVKNLQTLGVTAEELPDGFRVVGTKKPMQGRIETQNDHRIAMSFGVLGCVAGNAIEIDNPRCVAISYPDFWTDLGRAHQ